VDERNDWVWVKQRPGSCYGSLHGSLQWQLQSRSKIKLQNKDGAFVEYWLALALTTLPETSGNLDLVSIFVHERQAPADIALHVFSVGNNFGCPHVFPEIGTGSKTGHGRNDQWMANSHIDLATWNEGYN
jgi:hypothetical protein